jgi:AraC-like DNA-binding protein
MSRGTNSEDSLAEKIKNKLEEEIGNQHFGVEQLSEHFSLHRSTIYKIFSAHFKTTPSEYLKKLRIQRALRMLGESRLSVAEIAHTCGFQSANYFSRVIKATVGINPSMVRGCN